MKPSRGTDAIVAIVGLVSGACLYLHSRAVGLDLEGPLGADLALPASLAGIGFAVLLLAARRGVRRLARSIVKGDDAFARAYDAWDAASYAPFLLLLFGTKGLRVSVPVVEALLVLFALGQVLVTLRALGAAEDPRSRRPFFESNAWLAVLFLLSGMAALVYEVVWQRVLFSVYGINIESVTMIVSIFMLGLGLGALLGGRLARAYPEKLPWLFAACEITIGLFGAVSIPLIETVGSATLHLSLAGVAATVFAMLLLPVLMMGATLPLLVAHLTRRDPNVGAALGRLYSLNTLGAALASLLTVDLLFVLLGRQATVFVAVTLNLVVAVLVFRFARRMDARRAEEPAVDDPLDVDGTAAATPGRRRRVLLTSFVVGFLSLSQEIVWMRPMGYATQTAPQAFGQVLAVFLIGVALGSWKAKKICERSAERGGSDPERVIGTTLVKGGALYFVAFPLFAFAMTVSKGIGVPFAFLLVGTTAYLTGIVLPLLVDVGRTNVSHVYAANVAGATIGPLLTGFYLLDVLPFTDCAALLGAATVAAGVVLLAPRLRRAEAMRVALAIGIGGAAAVFLLPSLFRHIPERLKDGPRYAPELAFDHVVHNRSGILAMRRHPDGDIMYGGGIYDGSFNVGVAKDRNGISRGYMLAALHPDPKRVLQIGLATGSWTWVLTTHEAIEKITVVELNPGYPAIMAGYPLHRELLTSPKVDLRFDDGRRWLKRNPDARFDFILLNMTYHWRSNATNLLSKEFAALCRAHLSPGGVFYVNGTRDPDVGRTMAEVFTHVVAVHTFYAGSDAPFAMTPDERRDALLRYKRDGRSIILAEESEEALRALGSMAAMDLRDLGPELRSSALQVITDDNMLPEFKRIFADSAIGDLYRWHGQERPWATLLAP